MLALQRVQGNGISYYETCLKNVNGIVASGHGCFLGSLMVKTIKSGFGTAWAKIFYDKIVHSIFSSVHPLLTPLSGNLNIVAD